MGVTAIVLALIFIGCKKDPCKTTVCYNGGVCVEGNCDCPPGYSGLKCQEYDACHNVTCLNGGTCVNGQCDCPDGYTGNDCGKQVTPTKMRLQRIDVTKFPPTRANGSGWDASTGPDIYVGVYDKDFNPLWYSGYYSDATIAGTPYQYDISPVIDLSAPTDQYSIVIWDYDGFGTDENMGGITFVPYYSSSNGFPTIIDLDAGGGVAYKVYVSYIW